ncbi:unnamed protein product [Adineta steineri]|uniref:Uncharacterized protein n=1 Tax=Adineta steineri TaxID=433720 RepID=A0A815DKQ9_9BILA|nr:unnamed protein product [Adineta steineri]
MASAHQPKGRGRSRQQTNALESTVPTATEVNVATTSDSVEPLTTSQTTTMSGRGRGKNLKRKPVVPEPHMTIDIDSSNSSWKVSDLNNHQFWSNDRPLKPVELGTLGQQIKVLVNYFPVLQFPHKGLVYQYHFIVENKRKTCIPRIQRRALYNSWLHSFYEKHPQINPCKIVFDNQKIILTYEESLPNIDEFGITEPIMGINRANRSEEYNISVKRVGNAIDLASLASFKEIYEPSTENNLNIDDLQNIRQVLSIALHEHCSSTADYIYNRTFFRNPSPKTLGYWDLGLGKATWRGFYSCLLFTNGSQRLFMNLDVSHGIFQKKQSFLDFLRDVMLHSPCGKYHYRHNRNIKKANINDVLDFFDRNVNNAYYAGEIEYLLKNCKDLSVRSYVSDRVIGYKISSLGESASTQTFKWNERDNNLITVEDFYMKKYGIELEYPSLPVVTMRNGSFLPMEFLGVEPVRVKRITDEQRAMVCQKSSLNPSDYYQSIISVRNNTEEQYFEKDPFIAAWNLQIDPKMHITSARIIPSPKIFYNSRYQISPQNGSPPSVWQSTNIKFYHPTSFPSVWAMINLSSTMDKKSCIEFYNKLRDVANERGINCPAPVIYEEYDLQQYSTAQLITALQDLMKKNNDCKFFLVALPENSDAKDRTYGEIKKLCELEYGLGIVTQMIKVGKKPWNYSKRNNLLLKINTKLNGINSILDVPEVIKSFFDRGHHIMYVGIDLSHGAPGLSRGRSTVAVVASADDVPSRYFKEVYLQERPADTRRESWEYVVDMKQIMKSLIMQYYEKHQNHPPKAIVIYRDGISTSEFDTVFEKELTAIREACVELSSVYRPKLTYIVVNKRHHTRFFPEKDGDNVTAGTVVDSDDVTNPTTYSFFLNSHHSDKGTSRPTYYHVLYDDNKLKPDEVQMLTNALCYTSARCTRSISIPAPVKYADLLAFRANYYVNINEPSNTESTDQETNIPVNQSVDVNNTIKSQRIVLSSKLENDCSYFL